MLLRVRDRHCCVRVCGASAVRREGEGGERREKERGVSAAIWREGRTGFSRQMRVCAVGVRVCLPRVASKE